MSHLALAPIALTPLVGAGLAYGIGRIRKNSAGWIATAASFASFLLVVRAFRALGHGRGITEVLFNWFSFDTLRVDFALRFDSLSAVMCLVVTGVGTLIHLYSVGYMAQDDSRHRFFAYLNLFMFSMLVLVLGANMPVLFIGWEGVGLCSYLLIGFWFKNLAYAAAGRKAFVVNRIGDAGFLLAMFMCAGAFGTLDFASIGTKIAEMRNLTPFIPLFTGIALALFVGAAGKSAQIPLFVWLPDAMAGPTPVSALIHAATMVTAGIYLLARTHFFFSSAPEAMVIVTGIAALTAFVAGSTALLQNDIKKVLAYSTVSQLGFMFAAASAGAYWVAIFHVVTHAFFKGCLFLGAGSVIQGCHHEQDMRHMGGLWKKMPLTYVTYFISTLAIAGIAPFSGYYSKHAIMTAAAHSPYLSMLGRELVNGTLVVSAFLTAFYMTRSLVLTFHGNYRGDAHPHESPWQMTVPLIILAAMASVGGIVFAEPLYRYLELTLPPGEHHLHLASITEAILNSWLGLAGVAAGFIIYLGFAKLPARAYRALRPVAVLLERKYFFDELYGLILVRPLEGLSALLWKRFDQGMIDGAVNGAGQVVEAGGEALRFTQSGEIRNYAVLMFGALVIITALYLVY